MAVTTTVQEILTAAYARSTKNRPGTIATEATELLKLVGRALRGLFAVGAVVNPEFFGKSVAVPFAAPGWKRPEDAESVFYIENPAGAEVIVVPFRDRKADEGKPALYRFAQVFRSAGNALDPVAGDLTFYYSKRADLPAALNTVLDALWVECYNDLLIDEVAVYLALKDGRLDEVQELKSERDAGLSQFASFLQHETANESRRFGSVRQFNIDTLRPLLAGGAA